MLPAIPLLLKASVLIQNWKIVLIALMASVIFYQNVMETRVFFGANTLPYLERELAKANDNLLQCKDGNDKLSAAIGLQNNKFEQLNKQLINNQATFDKRFKEIANRQPAVAPITPVITQCEDVIDHIKTIKFDW